MNKMLLALGLAALAGGGVATVSWLDPFESESAPEDGDGTTAVVKRQDLMITLTEKGTLKTRNATMIRAETSAKIEWLVDEGVNVKKDDKLVELDKKETEDRLEQYQNQVTQLEAELKSAETEEVIQQGQNKTDVEKAELGLKIATVELEKLVQSDLPADERKLRLSIDEAETAVRREKDKVAAYEELRKEDFVTENDLQEARLRLRKAENDLETARIDLKSFVEYTRPLDLEKKQAAVTEAERGLAQARQRAEAQLAAKQAQVQQKRVSLDRMKKQLEKTKETLSKMTIVAPTDGTVLYGDPDQPWKNENIKAGSPLWPNTVLITLPDPSEMAVSLQIHEADISKLKKGMPAFVSSEVLKGQTFEGEIIKIDQVANAGRRWWGGDDVKRFTVQIGLKGQDKDLKGGTSAQVEIKIGEVKDVLSVPIQAVYAKEGSFFCYRQDGAKVERISVEPGASNDAFVEIKSGLSEGDRVLLHDPEIAPGAAQAETPVTSKP